MLKNMGVAVTMPIFEPSSIPFKPPFQDNTYRCQDYGGMTAESLPPRFCNFGANELDHYLCNVFYFYFALFNLKI